MLTMKNAAYNRATPLTMEQLLDTYAESPVESAMLILKKIVIGFDKKTNIAYPDPGPGVPWRDTPGILFSLWNYFVLFSALFAVTRKNTLTKEEKTLGIIIFVALVLPETFIKIEWRYLFAGYIALYYCFAFHFVGDAMEKADERRAILQESNYLAGLAIFSFLYLTCSFTLLA